MRYVIRVIAVFGEGTTYPNTFDAWDTIILLDADGTQSAIQSAIPAARSIFEHPVNQKALGYSTRPIMYSVASVSRYHDLKCGKLEDGNLRLLVTDMMSLTETDVQKIRSKQDISVPLRTLYVAQV